MSLSKFLLQGLLLFVAFGPALSRSVPHNSIEPFSTGYDRFTTPYTPMYSYDQGCMPYPAVAPNGDYSGGLKPTGSPGGSCRTSRFQQVYTRALFFTSAEQAGTFRGARYAVMYAMFFPKDQGDRQGLFGSIKGHRYDWEEIVVFIDNHNRAIKAAFSGHGGYLSINRASRYNPYWSNNRVRAKYGSMPFEFRNTWKELFSESFKNNAFFPSTKTSTSRPKEGCWSFLTQAMRDSITNVNWGKASPKIKTSVFRGKVTDAWNSPLI